MPGSPLAERIAYRACPLCEAICGLEIRTRGDEVVGVRGDPADAFSRGHVCPKAVALIDVHHDPDRLAGPVRRVGSRWEPIAWEEAFELVATRFAAIQREHGANALGIYLGNPNAHHVGSMLHAPGLVRALRTRNRFSATSVDQLPHHVVAHAMFGHMFLLPVPDIDRTAYWLVLGANPMASNGSMMTAPGVGARLKSIRERGGKVVVIDPCRTETAAAATGISGEAVRAIAAELRAAPSSVVYGRMGLSTQPFGTVCQWLIQLLNLATGNLDSAGGALPTLPAIPMTGPGTRPGGPGRFASRVSGRPAFGGELPVAAMAEEIETPGEGRIRAMLTIAGNPVSSTPNGRRVDRALAGLDFMASIDIYVNETTRHADVILPPASALAHESYDIIFNALAVRNVARHDPPVVAKPEGARLDWEIFNGLGAAYARASGAPFSPLPPPSVLLDAALRAGPHGKTLSIGSLEAAPHGVDLGPLEPSLMARLETPDGKVACAPQAFVADLARVEAQVLGRAGAGELLLVGRRHARSNNSWMHNAHRLVKGPRRDHLWIHPDDAKPRGIEDGHEVTLASRVGAIRVTARLTDRVMPGVVCLPHGFGQGREGVRLSLAAALPGASYNDVSDESAVDPLSGNAALNALPVTVAR